MGIPLHMLTLQNIVGCGLASWTDVCKNILSNVLHTEYSDQMITNSVKLNVVDTIGSEFCVSTEDARKLYDDLSRNIREKKKVVTSFKNVRILTPLFLNMSICQLYGQFEEGIINDYMDIVDMDEKEKKLLSIQIKKAKRYFKNPGLFKEIVSASSGDYNE